MASTSGPALARLRKKADAIAHAERATAELEKLRKTDELVEVRALPASLR